jgi:response regulator RpfG family c-di-GMP phosphodiesterase
MKLNPRILIIDDDKELIFNLKLLLEKHKYKISSARNGKIALKVLNDLENPPDLIISDISMPQMDGYQLFREIFKNPKWLNIPFVFLTGINDPKKIRKVKELGISDLLIKPFSEKELLATIQGKIEKRIREKELDNKIKNLKEQFNEESVLLSSEVSNLKESTILMLIEWDDKLGPEIEKIYPQNQKVITKLDNVAKNLFQTSVLIYGQDDIANPEDILLNLQWLNSKVYMLFDYKKEKDLRAKQKQFMICIICPNLNYLNSIQIKPVFHEIAEKYKNEENIAFKQYFKQILNILTFETPFLDI